MSKTLNEQQQNRVEFEALMIVAGKPQYTKVQGYFEEWGEHPVDSTVVAIVRDDTGKLHFKSPEDVIFLSKK
ncbi:hypothetical protein [Eisenibacter elegans]|jgi:hypothetical protein|uniref:hypothetical protein n=1 Tax=Eisenibacter elegans TaxID=997 RepID=UPI00047C6B80|nr:hypothetical protein [Eisenibacter elegans]